MLTDGKASYSQSAARSDSRSAIATLLVLMVAAYLTMFADAYLDSSWPYSVFEVVIIVGLGGVYYLLMVRDQVFRARIPFPWSEVVYFGVLLLIVGLVGYYGDIKGQWWLLALPVAGHAAEYRPIWLALACIATLIMISIVYYIVTQSIETLWFVPFFSAPAVMFVVIFTRIANRERNARVEIERLAGELKLANIKLGEYATKVEELATMRERNRMAREIHDTLGHYLTVVNVQIRAAQAIMLQSPDKANTALEKAQKLTKEGLAEVRSSVSMLRESAADRPLQELVAELVQTTETAGIQTHYEIVGDPVALPSNVSRTLYRTIQEGLTNVRRHSGATHAWLKIDYLDAVSDPAAVTLTIGDDGHGSADFDGGFGLLGMRERINLLNGQLEIETAPDAGFKLTVILPINQREKDSSEPATTNDN